MSLTAEDRSWIDDRFDRLHSRMDETARDVNAHFRAHSDTIQGVKDMMAPALAGHEEKHHDPLKRVGLIGGVLVVFGAAWEGMRWVVHHFSKGDRP